MHLPVNFPIHAHRGSSGCILLSTGPSARHQVQKILTPSGFNLHNGDHNAPCIDEEQAGQAPGRGDGTAMVMQRAGETLLVATHSGVELGEGEVVLSPTSRGRSAFTGPVQPDDLQVQDERSSSGCMEEINDLNGDDDLLEYLPNRP